MALSKRLKACYFEEHLSAFGMDPLRTWRTSFMHSNYYFFPGKNPVEVRSNDPFHTQGRLVLDPFQQAIRLGIEVDFTAYCALPPRDQLDKRALEPCFRRYRGMHIDRLSVSYSRSQGVAGRQIPIPELIEHALGAFRISVGTLVLFDTERSLSEKMVYLCQFCSEGFAKHCDGLELQNWRLQDPPGRPCHEWFNQVLFIAGCTYRSIKLRLGDFHVLASSSFLRSMRKWTRCTSFDLECPVGTNLPAKWLRCVPPNIERFHLHPARMCCSELDYTDDAGSVAPVFPTRFRSLTLDLLHLPKWNISSKPSIREMIVSLDRIECLSVVLNYHSRFAATLDALSHLLQHSTTLAHLSVEFGPRKCGEMSYEALKSVRNFPKVMGTFLRACLHSKRLRTLHLRTISESALRIGSDSNDDYALSGTRSDYRCVNPLLAELAKNPSLRELYVGIEQLRYFGEPVRKRVGAFWKRLARIIQDDPPLEILTVLARHTVQQRMDIVQALQSNRSLQLFRMESGVNLQHPFLATDFDISEMQLANLHRANRSLRILSIPQWEAPRSRMLRELSERKPARCRQYRGTVDRNHTLIQDVTGDVESSEECRLEWKHAFNRDASLQERCALIVVRHQLDVSALPSLVRGQHFRGYRPHISRIVDEVSPPELPPSPASVKRQAGDRSGSPRAKRQLFPPTLPKSLE